jgi:hypothetical protein
VYPLPASEAIEEIDLVCPYCGEAVTIVVEADLVGTLVQDCEVCCSPWNLQLMRADGQLIAVATRLDD